MKMKKVFKSSASYPVSSGVKPIIFTAVAIVALSGCTNNNLSPHKVLKADIPIHSRADKNKTESIEPVEPAVAGLIAPVQPVLPSKK